MKKLLFLVSLFIGAGAVYGEISETELHQLQRIVKINSADTLTVRDADKNKSEVLRFFTTQNEQSPYEYRVQVAVELKDKDGKTYSAKIMRYQGALDPEYTGNDHWELQIPQGELQRPKITAYVIEYGVMDGDRFVPVAVEAKGAKGIEALVTGADASVDEQAVLKHAYSYRVMGDENISETNLKTLRK